MQQPSIFRDYYRDHTLNCRWRGKVNEKLEKSAPYNFFLTRVRDCLETYFEDLTITFPELLDGSLGTLEHSVHISFMVEMPWLLAQYAANDLLYSPMTIICGSDNEEMHVQPEDWPIRVALIPPMYRFGRMHTKMSIFFYTDKSVRFAVYTANLVESDWTNRTQGIWISPKCPYLGDDVPINYGESITLFKVDIIRYLAHYEQPVLKQWIHRIQKCNLSEIKVCIVSSVPGQHDDEHYGYKKLNKILREHVVLPNPGEWDYVAQCSSIGSLGESPSEWLETFSKSMEGRPGDGHPLAKVIYPSFENVQRSLDGLEGGECLPYMSKVHDMQKWLSNHLYRWEASHRHRTGAIPHIKSYAKLKKDGTSLAWFLLTSANLSKAAWGNERGNGKYVILSYELGVLFLPLFLVEGNVFKVKKGGYVGDDRDQFPLPYDAPIQRYKVADRVFLIDKD